MSKDNSARSLHFSGINKQQTMIKIMSDSFKSFEVKQQVDG